MQTECQVILKHKNRFYATRLIGYALGGFYYFEDDEVENEIERLWIKYKVYNFHYPNNAWSRIRSELMARPKIREKITNVALKMFR